MPATKQRRQRTERDPGFTLIRRYEPDTEAQLEALALLLGIRLLPPLPQRRSDAA